MLPCINFNQASQQTFEVTSAFLKSQPVFICLVVVSQLHTSAHSSALTSITVVHCCVLYCTYVLCIPIQFLCHHHATSDYYLNLCFVNSGECGRLGKHHWFGQLQMGMLKQCMPYAAWEQTLKQLRWFLCQGAQSSIHTEWMLWECDNSRCSNDLVPGFLFHGLGAGTTWSPGKAPSFARVLLVEFGNQKPCNVVGWDSISGRKRG